MKATDVRNNRPTGKIASGGDNAPFHSVTQPVPDQEHGAPPARTRTSESSVTAGHHVSGQGTTEVEFSHEAKHGPAGDSLHVSAPTVEAKSREEYVKAERERKEEKTASPSGRRFAERAAVSLTTGAGLDGQPRLY